MIEEHTLRVLDFFKIIAQLKTYSHSAEGGELIDSIRPAKTFNEALQNLAKTKEIILSLIEKPDLWRTELPAMGAILKRLGKINGILTAKEAAVFLTFFPAVRGLRQFYQNRGETYPIWSKQVESIADFSRLHTEVDNLTDQQGRIKDKASQNLARIRRELIATQNKTKDLLNGYLHTGNLAKIIAEKIITQRNGRYVIPVVKGQEKVLRGIVQDSSKSGATVFIEPEKALPLNNRLISLAAEEAEEITLLLTRSSDQLRHQLPELIETTATLAEFDSFYARACLAETLSASAPRLNQKGQVEINEGRHPILILAQSGKAVVPQTIEVGHVYRTLIITGPNTGGKTVALKTVGILTLMALSGMYIPAREGSRISFFERIFADIGDEQSLEQSLSTFSAHMTHVVRMLESAAPSTLFLLDELGAGTDPTEGAALAVSIIEKLHDQRATTLVATHFRLLKNYAAEHPEMENASVEFNEKTLLPMYKIKMGYLGSSRAIITARRLGLSEEVTKKAESRLSARDFKLDQLLVKLENENHQLEAIKEEIEAKERSINRLKSDWEEKSKQLKIFAAEKRQQTLKEVKRLLTQTRKELVALLETARKEEKSQAIKALSEEVKRREVEITSELERLNRPQMSAGQAQDFKEGDIVHSEQLNLSGKVINLNKEKGTARLESGEKIIELAAQELIRIDKPLTSTLKDMGFEYIQEVKVGPELNLIGQRVDEAIPAVDKYIDSAVMSRFNTVYIIHGVGGEVLRKAVSEVLAEHHHVKSFRSGQANEGGIGVTVVELDT